MRLLYGHGFFHPQHMHGYFNNIFHDGHMRPKVKLLKHHGKLATNAFQLFLIAWIAIGLRLNRLTFYINRALGWGFKKIDTAQDGRLCDAPGG